jgi:hypothetical protein
MSVSSIAFERRSAQAAHDTTPRATHARHREPADGGLPLPALILPNEPRMF